MKPTERRITETINKVLKDIRRGSIEGHRDSAFDEGYKVFVSGIYNLSRNDAALVGIELGKLGIESEIAIDGDQGASWVTLGFIVWKARS